MRKTTTRKIADAAAPTLRERAVRLRDAAGRFLRRDAAKADAQQFQPAPLPDEIPADRTAGSFPATAAPRHDAGRGQPEDQGRDRAAGRSVPSREHDMGRHETFDSAVPLADELLSSVATMARAAAAGDDADAALLRAGAVWAKAEAAYRVADAKCSAAEEASEVKEPTALSVQDGDEALGLARLSHEHRNGGRWYYLGSGAEEAAGKLRRPQLRAHTRPVQPSDNLPSDAVAVTRGVPWPEAQARADAIVRAWDTWQDEIAAAEVAAGLPAAEAELRRCSAIMDACEAEITTAVAVTLAGVKIKAQVARRDAGFGYAIEEALHNGLVRDVLALSDANGHRDGGSSIDPIHAAQRALALIAEIEREWPLMAAVDVLGDDSPAAEAAFEAAWARRKSLIASAEALPCDCREARHAKALALAWVAWAQREEAEEAGGIDSRLVLHIDASLTGSPPATEAVATNIGVLHALAFSDSHSTTAAHSSGTAAKGDGLSALPDMRVLVKGFGDNSIDRQLAAMAADVLALAKRSEQAIADSGAKDAVSAEVRAAVEGHRDAIATWRADPSSSDEAFDRHAARTEAADDALRTTPCRSLADLRAKLIYLLPIMMPDMLDLTHADHLKALHAEIERLCSGRAPTVSPESSARDAVLLARRSELLEAFADRVAARPIENSSSSSSPKGAAATRVCRRLWALIKDTLALSPTTPDGLAVIGLALALEYEAALYGSERGDEEWKLVMVAKAILSVTGTSLPPGYIGFGDEPDYREREHAAMTGEGRLPAWALDAKGAA